MDVWTTTLISLIIYSVWLLVPFGVSFGLHKWIESSGAFKGKIPLLTDSEVSFTGAMAAFIAIILFGNYAIIQPLNARIEKIIQAELDQRAMASQIALRSSWTVVGNWEVAAESESPVVTNPGARAVQVATFPPSYNIDDRSFSVIVPGKIGDLPALNFILPGVGSGRVDLNDANVVDYESMSGRIKLKGMLRIKNQLPRGSIAIGPVPESG